MRKPQAQRGEVSASLKKNVLSANAETASAKGRSFRFVKEKRVVSECGNRKRKGEKFANCIHRLEYNLLPPEYQQPGVKVCFQSKQRPLGTPCAKRYFYVTEPIACGQAVFVMGEASTVLAKKDILRLSFLFASLSTHI